MKRFLLLGIVAAWPLSAAADGLEEKLAELLARHENGAESPKEFEIQEAEANEYIRELSQTELPEGVESPWIKFEESLAIVGATLDLDKLEGQLPNSTIFQLLSGRVPAEVTTRVTAAGGVGKLVLERVTLAGVDLPPDFVTSLIGEPDAGPFLPPGFRLGQAFTLPFHLDSIRLQPGAALVLQRASK